jgi:uncharacterized protein (TIGR02444 family)
MTEPTADPTSSGSPFWRFSVAFYRQPGVAEACLALQDRCGVDVNLLLFLLWMAHARRSLAADQVRVLDARLGRWRAEVVRPLREMRRALKADPPLVGAAEAEAFRGRVKALELESERLQQEAMQALADGLVVAAASSPAEAARANVDAYERAAGRDFDRSSVDVLLAAFARE